MKDLAIIILDWNGAEDTIECLKGLNNFSLYDIYLLDNGSSDENVEKVRKFLESDEYKNRVSILALGAPMPETRDITYLLSNQNLGFACGNNTVSQMISLSYKYVLLLNNDTDVPSGTIEHMLQTAKARQCVAITCDIRIYYRKEELWNAGGYFTLIGERKYYSQKKIDAWERQGVEYIDADFITGCAMLLDTSYIRKEGLFTDLFFHGEEDFNLCKKLKKMNRKVGVDLKVRLYHKVGKTIERSSTSKEYNKMLVNYSNRVIDYKYFLTHTKWLVWRFIYLTLLFGKRVASGMSVKDTRRLVRRIHNVSSNYDNVKKPVFDKLIKLDWDSEDFLR